MSDNRVEKIVIGLTGLAEAKLVEGRSALSHQIANRQVDEGCETLQLPAGEGGFQVFDDLRLDTGLTD